MHRRDAVIDDKAFAALDAVLVDGFAICALLHDEAGHPDDYRFLRVNSAFAALTGLGDAEGRTARELSPRLADRWIEAFARAGDGREKVHVEGGVSTGQTFEVWAAPVEPAPCFALIFRDVSARERLAAEREAALAEARQLLQELNHRVMNSFASIGAVVAMETRAASAEARPALERLGSRIQALGALYRRLGAAPRADGVEARDYLGGIVEALGASVGPPLTVAAAVDPLWLPTKAAVPLGLVVNELATNAVKHAFRPGQGGRVDVRLDRRDGTCRLVVEDDGGGVVAGRTNGIGQSLVRAFVAELGGKVAVDSSDRGTRVEVTFPTPGEPRPSLS